MAKQWFVGESIRNREVAASVSVVALGFQSYLPIMQRYRRIGRKLVETSVSRFGCYLFIRFDRHLDNWGELLRAATHRPYFRRILCNADGNPSPVPEEAMAAIRAYQPPIVKGPEPIMYHPGQRVTCIIGGRRMEAVFVGYAGSRQFVRTWIFGRESVTEVRSAELEPLELDVTTSSCPSA